jgi:hypothetical protein
MTIQNREIISACFATYMRPSNVARSAMKVMSVARTTLGSAPTIITKRITEHDATITRRIIGRNGMTKNIKETTRAILNPERTIMCDSPATRNVFCNSLESDDDPKSIPPARDDSGEEI